MTPLIVVEGETDRLIIERVLTVLQAGQDAEVISAGGKSNARSLARSLLVARQVPVVLFVDADTIDPRQLREQRALEEAYMNFVPVAPTKVILASPSIESVLLGDDFVESHLGRRLTPSEQVEVRYNPKKVLADLLGQADEGARDIHWLVSRFSDDELRRVAKSEPFRQLAEFLGEVAEDPSIAQAR